VRAAATISSVTSSVTRDRRPVPSAVGLVQLHHVAGRIAHKALMAGPCEMGHPVDREAGPLEHGRRGVEVVDLESEVVEGTGCGLLQLDQVELALTEVEPEAREAEVGPIGEWEPEVLAVEHGRGGEVVDRDIDVMEPPHRHGQPPIWLMLRLGRMKTGWLMR